MESGALAKRVSVLMPTYKPGQYLERCLKSLDAQSLSKLDFKVYIALNGLRGEFESFILDVLRACSFEYEFFYLEQAGVSHARNFLIDNSDEEFIVFVDD